MSEKQLVLFVHSSGVLYGSDKVLLSLVTDRLFRDRVEPIVVVPCDGPLAEELRKEEIEIHIADVAKIRKGQFTPKGIAQLVFSLCKSAYQINRIVRGRRISLVHSNTLSTLGGAMWSFLFARPHVWHAHEIVDRPRIVSFGLAWLVNRASNRVVAVSTAVSNWLITQQPSMAKKCVVIPNGLPISKRAPSHGCVSTRGAIEGGLTVTLMGRIYGRKGHLLLIQAAKILAENDRIGRAQFLIVGEPAVGYEGDFEAMKDAISRAGLDERFRFVPYVNEPNSVWSITDIAVVPSIEPESFGLVAIEAMSNRLPVIAAAHGGILDVVLDGVTGILFDPREAEAFSDALGKLIHDPQLRKSLGEEGFERQKNLFSLGQQVSQMLALYEDL